VTDRLLDAKQIAALLGVPETWVRDQARVGAIPHVRLGKYVRFDRADVEAWIETCKRPGRPTELRR
jgi:excisionase family DNA binding protein